MTDFSDFIECETCNAKPGSPVLCRGCLSNRETITKQAEWIETLERQVDDLLNKIREGECRFNCRTRRAMFIIGGRYVFDNWDKLAKPADVHLDKMYDNWLKEEDYE